MGSNAKDDIFYTATILEYTARATGNTRAYIADKVGVEGMRNIFDFADVNHCLSFEQVADELIEAHGIEAGSFFPEKSTDNAPKVTSIGKVYARLVEDSQSDTSKYPDELFSIFKSKISEWMTNYKSAFYYSPRDYISHSYQKQTF